MFSREVAHLAFAHFYLRHPFNGRQAVCSQHFDVSTAHVHDFQPAKDPRVHIQGDIVGRVRGQRKRDVIVVNVTHADDDQIGKRLAHRHAHGDVTIGDNRWGVLYHMQAQLKNLKYSNEFEYNSIFFQYIDVKIPYVSVI